MVLKKYPTSFFAQLTKIVLEKVNSDLICQIFNIQKAPSKITISGVQQQLNSVSRRLIFEDISVRSCQKSSSN